MREILFRGKSLNAGNMVCGDLVCWANGKTNIHVTMFDDKNKKYNFPVDPETVGQFTGLTDKNGKKIFEGDIIEDVWKVNGYIARRSVYVVVFYRSCFGYQQYLPNKSVCAFPIEDGENGIIAEDCEVIGNIHENPELLKAGAQK